METFRLSLVDLTDKVQRRAILDLTHEYFLWMNQEIMAALGISIAQAVGMEMNLYVETVADSICKSSPPESCFYLAMINNQAAGMGGLRKLSDGSAEMVRIYTRPELRGNGIGSKIVNRLLEEARSFGYKRVKLDTAKFMTSAHRIYHAAGFSEIPPYDGAEPPEVLQPVWLYMQRQL